MCLPTSYTTNPSYSHSGTKKRQTAVECLIGVLHGDGQDSDDPDDDKYPKETKLDVMTIPLPVHERDKDELLLQETYLTDSKSLLHSTQLPCQINQILLRMLR